MMINQSSVCSILVIISSTCIFLKYISVCAEKTLCVILDCQRFGWNSIVLLVWRLWSLVLPVSNLPHLDIHYSFPYFIRFLSRISLTPKFIIRYFLFYTLPVSNFLYFDIRCSFHILYFPCLQFLLLRYSIQSLLGQ